MTNNNNNNNKHKHKPKYNVNLLQPIKSEIQYIAVHLHITCVPKTKRLRNASVLLLILILPKKQEPSGH